MTGRIASPLTQTRVRYRDDTFELRCNLCLTYLPLTLDFWQPRHGVRRCKACWRAYKAAHERTRSQDLAVREGKREANRIRYRLHRDKHVEYMKGYRERTREHSRAYNREYRRQKKAARLEAMA